MVVVLHANHFCVSLFYDYSPQTHELSEQSGFDDNGEGIEGPLLSGQAQRKVSRIKQLGEHWQGEVGRGREIFPLHFLSSVFFSSSHSHYIQPTCTSECLVQNSLNRSKLLLVFHLGTRCRYLLSIKVSLTSRPWVLLFCSIKVLIFSPNAYQQDKFRLDT